MEKIYKNVFREIRETVGQLNEYYDIKLLHAEMYLLGIQTGGNMGDVPEELLKKKISGYPWLVNNEKASSIRSQIVLLRQRYIYQRFLNNPEFLKYLNASDELFRKNTLLKKVYYRDYLTHLYNFISINISALSLKELDTFITEVEKLRTEMHESEFGNTSQSFYITKMRWYISNNKYKECLQYFKNTPLLSKNLSTSELDERLTIKSLLIEASLLGKEYKTALNWINSLLNEGYKTTRTDLFCHGRILLLCLHFSIENYDFLPNLTLQAKRFYKKYTAQNKAFDCLLDFFQKKEAAFYFANDRKKVLLELQQNLSELIKDPKLKIVLSDSFDYLKWLKTQLS